MNKIHYVFIFGSIISIILSFIFPIIIFDEFDFEIPFWIYGSSSIPFANFRIGFDFPHKIISLLYIIIIFFLIRLMFISKNSDSIDLISENCQKWGFIILALYFFWNLSTFVLGAIIHFYGFKITFAFSFPIISGLLLIFSGFLQAQGFGEESEEKHDYINANWLKHQYYDLGKSIQDIADGQKISMITIRKWLEKIESDFQNKNHKDSVISKT
ncbi:MAG: hypothetical protein ACFFDH_12665 [Promethearchaeota archaeon]